MNTSRRATERAERGYDRRQRFGFPILDGLKKMAMLRVYTRNGGIVEAADIRIAQKTQARREELSEFAEGFKKYNDYAEKTNTGDFR